MLEPLIVAVEIEMQACDRLTSWRERYFPVERNYLPAHLMIYHRLDGGAVKRVQTELEAVASTVEIDSVHLIFNRLNGNAGYVGIEVESPGLHAIKRRLDMVLADLLVPQDRQGYRPHVTLVNKVSKEEGARSLAAIAAEFTPFRAQAQSLELHAYEGGPWRLLERYPFQGRKHHS